MVGEQNLDAININGQRIPINPEDNAKISDESDDDLL